MDAISSTAAAATSFAQPAPANQTNSVPTAADDTQSGASPRKSTTVKISMAGMMLAGREKKAVGKNNDIDKSGLPDEIKRILKLIREIKEKLADAQQKLQQVMSNTRLSEDARLAQAAQYQATVRALSGALVDANQMLAQVTKDLCASKNLNKEDLLKIAELVMK